MFVNTLNKISLCHWSIPVDLTICSQRKQSQTNATLENSKFSQATYTHFCLFKVILGQIINIGSFLHNLKETAARSKFSWAAELSYFQRTSVRSEEKNQNYLELRVYLEFGCELEKSTEYSMFSLYHTYVNQVKKAKGKRKKKFFKQLRKKLLVSTT